MNTDALLSKLNKIKSNGNGKWLACCPAHFDKSPSLAIKHTDDGKILLHCFSGCAVADVVAALGLTLADLMPENPSYQKGSKVPKFNKYELFDCLVHSGLILSMGIRKLLNFNDLTPEDLILISKAEESINDIAREVRR